MKKLLRAAILVTATSLLIYLSASCSMLTDGINASHNAEDYLFDTQSHHQGETLKLHMASGGGFVIKFGKLNVVDHL